ncbi:uncharacterized protein LOC119340515 isoform X2 [Triticum dicoccoides]|nr:uncharacterized protein LOC119340515 isoform X2 [Triticum dicoccoides]
MCNLSRPSLTQQTEGKPSSVIGTRLRRRSAEPSSSGSSRRRSHAVHPAPSPSWPRSPPSVSRRRLGSLAREAELRAHICASPAMDHKDEHSAHPDQEVEEEEDEEAKRAVGLGHQVPLKDQLELDKDDESLRRWKGQLLGQVDTEQLRETAEPKVKVLNMSILSPDRGSSTPTPSVRLE